LARNSVGDTSSGGAGVGPQSIPHGGFVGPEPCPARNLACFQAPQIFPRGARGRKARREVKGGSRTGKEERPIPPCLLGPRGAARAKCWAPCYGPKLRPVSSFPQGREKTNPFPGPHPGPSLWPQRDGGGAQQQRFPRGGGPPWRRVAFRQRDPESFPRGRKGYVNRGKVVPPRGRGPERANRGIYGDVPPNSLAPPSPRFTGTKQRVLLSLVSAPRRKPKSSEKAGSPFQTPPPRLSFGRPGWS